MIIDDDNMVTYLHQVILEESGLSHNPVICNSADKALEEIARNKENNLSWLVFLDINMPGMTGWQFLDELERTVPEQKVRVVIVSSSIDKKDRDKSATYPNVIAFTEKPLQVEQCIEIREKLVLEDY